jgi:hypothetical protein
MPVGKICAELLVLNAYFWIFWSVAIICNLHSLLSILMHLQCSFFRGVTLTPHRLLVPRSKIEQSYTSTLLKGLCGLWQDETYLPMFLLTGTLRKSIRRLPIIFTNNTWASFEMPQFCAEHSFTLHVCTWYEIQIFVCPSRRVLIILTLRTQDWIYFSLSLFMGKFE